MKNTIKNFYKNNLLYLAKEKLSKITIFLIIILDLIVLNILIDGIDFQSNIVNHPKKIYANSCLSIIDSDLSQFKSYYYKKSYNLKEEYLSRFYLKEKDYKNLDERCLNIEEKLKEIDKNIDIDKLVSKDKELIKNIEEIENKIAYIEKNYNTVLFQEMANHSEQKSILDDQLNLENIKQKYEENKQTLEELNRKRDELKDSFKSSNVVVELIEYINGIKDDYNNDENDAYKYYYYKIDFLTILFLLPLVIIFFLLVKYFIKKERYILYVVFKNLLYITLIPTIINIFALVYKLLPKLYLEQLILFFYNLDIPFLVYYLMIIVVVAIFILFIIKMQKRFKEQNEKLKKNRISMIKSYNSDKCNSCGNKVDYISMNYCPCCKNNLRSICKSCGKNTISFLHNCQNCGEDI
ncbi:hypothetical protein [Arcobacter porcinus]|uniref:ABC transporter permease n=1 Tax=Arcobacter porcinus TaxID=1935204 RepID=A0ABX2YEZ6_9BACT|nr:hypothetical protein [Arcobacter porcinus]OCL82396.1 hypothetical protein AAW29_01339 [Arcobacter porcinus]OCL82612.1 hypothetical protein AAW30_01436 [Arcobacter porcinus]OCL93373.1 hypothetical protein AAX28_00916 [Arcobacter porcinus]